MACIGTPFLRSHHHLIYLLLWICWDVAAAFRSPKFEKIACRSRNEEFGVAVTESNTHHARVTDRRDFVSLAKDSSVAFVWMKAFAAAAEESESPFETAPKPFAPLEALLPAALQRHLLKTALQLTTTAMKVDASATSAEKIEQQLRVILEPPSAIVTPQRRAISMTRRYILDQKELLAHPVTRLSGRTFRAAMNVYTSNLRFGESYLWNAPRSETKRWIREIGQLPSVQQVITADLDLRDLYRNQVQTLIEDAQAELYNKSQAEDLGELKTLLSEATDACDKWFQLISLDDLRQAEVKLQELSESGLGRKADDILVKQLPKQTFDGYNFFAND